MKKIPYTKEAYIHIRDTLEPESLLNTCVDFCKAAGAERIYATGHGFLEQYPLYTTLVQLQCGNALGMQSDVSLFPVQEKTAEQWRKIYNERMLHVPSATYLSWLDMKNIIGSGNAYFVHEKGVLLGIGMVCRNQIEVIASVVPGAGGKIMQALCSLVPGDTVMVTVAANNVPAMDLYKRLGFLSVKELESWYQII